MAQWNILRKITIAELMGISQEDFLDFEKLQRDFKTFCPDYMEPFTAESRSHSVEFLTKIIYTVGPAVRTDKSIPKMYTFHFKNDPVVTDKIAATDDEGKEAVGEKKRICEEAR